MQADFWMLSSSPIYCCSFEGSSKKDPESCNDFVHPHKHPDELHPFITESTTKDHQLTTSTTPLEGKVATASNHRMASSSNDMNISVIQHFAQYDQYKFELIFTLILSIIIFFFTLQKCIQNHLKKTREEMTLCV